MNSKKKNVVQCISALSLSLCFFITAHAQVLDTGNPAVAAALSNAQVEGNPLANFFQKRTPMMDQLFQLVKDDDGITRHYVGAEVGSAYENDNFALGNVYYNTEELGRVYYRFNAYNNEIEIKKTLLDEEKQQALIKNAEVKLVTPEKELVYREFIDRKGKAAEGYLTLLKTGSKYTLYRRLYVKFTDAKAAANSMVNPTPSRFTQYTEFYFQENDGETIKEMPRAKKNIAKLFSKSKAPKIQDYFKKKKPEADNENDMMNFFNHIDSLE